VQPSSSNPRADLVLSGGGVKGIAHVGALSALEEHGYEFRRVAGTSAGAIVAALAAAGMPADEMRATLTELELGAFRDPSIVDRVPLVGPALSVALENGVFEGDRIRDWLAETLERRGVRTFGDLRLDDPGSTLSDEQSYRLVVMATDITRGELIRLPWDYGRYGLEASEQPVADAVRASLSIPFFYEPCRLESKVGPPSTLVDGGVLSNFPIDTFDRTDGAPPRWPTFGVTLIPILPAGLVRVLPGFAVLRRGPVKFLESLVATMIVGHDQSQLSKPWVAARTIAVDTDSVGFIDFDVDQAAQAGLFDEGRTAADAFLATWNFTEYRQRFRGG
jgi:NTE family protein